MNKIEKIKLFRDVFDPKKGEKILFVYDVPHDNLKDNNNWKERREMAKDWFEIFKELGDKEGFSVEIKDFFATGVHNSILSEDLINFMSKYNLIIAMTEYSISSTLLNISKSFKSSVRGASMPTVEKRMEETALKANYSDVQKYATSIKEILDRSIGAEVIFSTGDELFFDLRNRTALADKGECRKPGQFINFPSGEACKAPYEATNDEIDEYGKSKTEGIIPLMIEGELVKYKIKNNKIVQIIGKGKRTEEKRIFYNKNESRKNIAELGIGCNPNAVVTGNPLEDEKVGGLHIGYGMSNHLGGKVVSDMHFDDTYPKNGPIETKVLILIHKDGTKTRIIKNGELQYQLLK